MRYLILLSAVLMQMCLGATYSWSVFVGPLKALTGLQQGPVQAPFTLFYLIFPLTMVFAGNLLPRTGPRLSAMLGGALFGCGWLLAGFGDQSFLFTSLGIGVLAGIGAGFAYIVPIAVCVRWFPNHKGLVTGIAVAGFGAGAALISKVAGLLLSLGHTPFAAFTTLGVCYLLCVLPAAATMRFPERSDQPQAQLRRLTGRMLLADPVFRILYLAMLTGLAAGFAVNANLKEIFAGPTEAVQVGVTAVALFALANGAGRISWGRLSDKVAIASAIQCNLFLQALVLLLSPLLVSSIAGFWTLALITGFNYGGVLVLYASCTSRRWGAEQLSQVYSWLFSSNIPAAVAPILAGYAFDTFGTFTPALHTAAILLIIAALNLGRYGQEINRGLAAAPAGSPN